MASYRVFELPHALPQIRAAGKDVRFVRDGFTFPAVVFPSIWLLWHRLWISFAVLLMLTTTFVFIADMISPLLVVFLNALIGLYLGFEGTNLKAIKLKHAGWHEVGVVIASDEEEAEVRFLSKRVNEEEEEDASTLLPENLPARPSMPIRVPQNPHKTRSIIGGLPPYPAGSRS